MLFPKMNPKKNANQPTIMLRGIIVVLKRCFGFGFAFDPRSL